MCSGRTPSTSGPTERGSRISGTANVDIAKIDRPIARSQARLEVQEVHRRRADEVGDEHAGRPIVDFLRRADLLDPARVHDRDAIGHRHRLVLIVRDIDGGRRDAIMQIAQLAAHQLAELGIERTERLVHEERLRPPDHRAPKRDALPVAAGQFRGLARQQVLDPQQPRGLGDPLAHLAPRHALALERKADVLLDVHMRIEGEQLEDEGNVARRGATERDVLAVEQNAPAGRQLETGDHAQRRRLAAARGSEHRKERCRLRS